MAQGNFHAVDAINGRIAGGGTAERGDRRIGYKAHMHQVVLDGFRKVEAYQYAALAHFQFA